MKLRFGAYCGAINCSNNQKYYPEISLFRFPKDAERSKKWLTNTRRDDLMKKDTQYLYNNIRICALHFEKSQFMNEAKKKLVWNAVPTLFDVPNKPPSISLKRKLPNRSSVSEPVLKNIKPSCCLDTSHNMSPEKHQCSARGVTIVKQEPKMEPVQQPSSVFGVAAIKQEPVETDPPASPKQDTEFVFVKEEIPEWDSPEGQVSARDPLSIDEEEYSPSEDYLLSSTSNIVKVEDEEAVYEDNGEECSASEESLRTSSLSIVKMEDEEEEEMAVTKDEGQGYSASEESLRTSSLSIVKMEDEEEEEMAVTKDEGREHGQQLQPTSSGSEPERDIPVRVEDNSGKNGSGDLSGNSSVAAGTHNMKQSSIKIKASVEKIRHSCNVCHKTFARKSHMKTHLRLHTGERPYKCDVCNKAYTDIRGLQLHSVVHTGEGPYSCGVCNKLYKRNSSLKRHLSMHTGECPHRCGVCYKSFTSSHHLKRHLLSHTGEKPHCCNVCNKTFRQSGALKQHSLLHTGERPHSCGVCKKTFTQIGALKQHLLLHTAERPHSCGVCNKTFAYRCRLKKHLQTHTGEHPYSCKECHKRFRTSTKLKNHSHFHTGEVPYRCNIC